MYLKNYELHMVDISKRFLLKKWQKSIQQPLPWVENPKNFTSKCTRCRKCVTVCETQVIELVDGGFPSINFQKGECTFCYGCADVCPENLFMPITSIPWQQQITINERCLAENKVECRSCNDSCEPQAIRFQLTTGSVATPVVNFGLCNGCGACISYCPVDAIVMKSQSSI